MYCPSCQQERLSGRSCASCGTSMHARPREVIERELGHIHFLLAELKRWDNTYVPKGSRQYLSERYERQTRILLSVLAELPAAAPVEAPAPALETVSPAEALAAAAAVVEPAAVEAPAEVAAPAAEESPAQSPVPSVAPVAETPPAPAPEEKRAAAEEDSHEEEEASDEEEETSDEATPLPLPPVAAEPLFDAPQVRSRTAQLVEETSTWNTVWRPFLYESIGWFIGAFLIVAGSLYLAFDSWSGLTSFSRSLVVFGMTAGYSAAFSVCGALLARREVLANAGRILGLIGAAVAPLAGVALGPVDSLSLEGVPLMLLLPVLLAWAGGAAFLVRTPAEHFDAPSRRLVQGALAGTTVMMGVAPLLAHLGGFALVLDVLPCALFFVLSRQPLAQPRTSKALAFALAAPLYLSLFFAVRLHLALAAAGSPPLFGTYAPFLAFLLATCLAFRTLEPQRAADSLSLGVIALQVTCVVLAGTGRPPAFFLTAAVFTWTAWQLSLGTLPRLRWLYAAYAGAYLAYASSSQLIPGFLQLLLERIKASLGYPPAQMLPFHYGALTAVPFVLAGVVLASRLLSRARSESSPRFAETAQVLLRATAGASVFFVLFSHAGSDMRPSFWTTLALTAVCVASGLLFERLYLSLTGAALTFFVPISAFILLGSSEASAMCGMLALVLAGLSLMSTRRTCLAFSGAVGWLASMGFLFGVSAGSHVPAVAGMVLSGIAALAVAWNLANPYLLATAAFAAAAVLPKLAFAASPSLVPLALALAALGLAALGELGGRARLVGIPGVVYALLAFAWGLSLQLPWLGVVILVGAAAVAVSSRSFPVLRPLAVVLAAFALLPRVGDFSAWTWMTPALSVALFVLWGLGASLASVRWGRSPSTLAAGIVALLLPLLAVSVARGEQPYPLLLGAALAALLTARALHPSVSVVAAALLAGAYVVDQGAWPSLALATFLSVLALLESSRTAFRVLAGERRFALAATLCALPLLATACLQAEVTDFPPVLLGALVLPVVWMRACRQPFFAALSPLLALSMSLEVRPLLDWAPALPLLSLLLTRAVAHSPAACLFLTGRSDEKVLPSLSRWMQASFMVLGVVLMPILMFRKEGGMMGLPALALALLPGPKPHIRVGLATALLLMAFPLHPGAAIILLALGFLSHHVPARLWAFFHAEPDKELRPVAAFGAIVLTSATVLLHRSSPGNIATVAGVLLVCAFLFSERWLFTASLLVLAGASVGTFGKPLQFEWRESSALAFASVALVSALLSAVCQLGSVQRALTRVAARLSPGIPGTWSEPLWVAGAIATSVPVLGRLLDVGPGHLSLPVAFLAGLASLVLMVTRERWMANAATGLLALVLIAVLPPPWTPAVLSGVGLTLCMVGTWLENRGVTVGAALHHSGWVLSLLAVLGLRYPKHPGMALCVLFGAGSAWAVVYRRRERELVGWIASLVAGHLLLISVGMIYSTGRGSAFILPVFGAFTALLATLALFVATPRARWGAGNGFAGLAMLEVLGGLMLVDGAAGVEREAIMACVTLAVLCFALVRQAVKEEDELAAFLAQGTVVLGYLAVRLHGLAVSELGTVDSIASLVGGALFSGLYVFVQREGAGLKVFRRPALWGAFLFPVAGLLTAPWGSPLVVALLLVGYAAHFAALGLHPSQRGSASLASAAAFNGALFLVWQGTGAGEPQYYVIPAGLSLLVLLRVFREALSADAQAKLRALAITLVYVAGAWKPLMFEDGRAMLLCVFLCVVGVAAGIALRIRSYVYLGSAFMVTCILANLVRFGIRDHRMGAAFLSLLGVGVVGFMVLFTAKRAELLQRYERVRSLLDTWEG